LRRTRLVGPINGFREIWLPDLGDGSDGSPGSSSFTVAKQTYQWVNYTLDNGHTITLSSSYKPSIIRCRGTFTLNGAINGMGKGHSGGAATTGDRGNVGSGPGRGIPIGSNTDGGAGAGHAAWATNRSKSYGGGPYDGFIGLLTGNFSSDLCVGSGACGGGGSHDGEWGEYASGGKGGNGGGGIIIICQRFICSTGSINVNGENGGNGTQAPHGFKGAGGGGGSGGLVIILADVIELPATGTIITATGGAAGLGADTAESGTAGTTGRIYLCYLNSITPTDAASRCNPAATVLNLADLPIGIA
jgi:hypothetical protein